MKLLNFKVTEKIYKQLKEYIEKRGQTKSAILREALFEYLEKNR